MTDAELRAYLSREDTQRRLRNVVAGVLRDGATRDLVGELAARAQMAILDGQARPESLETMPSWVDGVARNTVREHFRQEKDKRKVFSDRPIVGEGRADADGGAADAYDGGRDQHGDDGARAPAAGQAGHSAGAADAADSADADADAPDTSGEATPDAFMLSRWLRSRARKDPDERELLELLAYKARTKKTYAAIAAERGTTVNAINNRVYRLRLKYGSEWQQHKRRRDTMLLAWLKAAKIAAVVALVAFAGFLVWLVLHPRPEEVRPVDDVPQLRPAPTASADPTRDIADPTRQAPTQPEDKPPLEGPKAGGRAAGAGAGKGAPKAPSAPSGSSR